MIALKDAPLTFASPGLTARKYQFSLPGIIILLGVFFPAHQARAQRTIVDPTGDTLCLLYYHVANQTPPFDQFAQNAPSVANANEFNKAQALADEISRIKLLYASLADVGFIRTNIDMSLGTYDSQMGEYDLTGFGGNDYVNFTCFGDTNLQLEFDNSDYAQSWTLNETAAEDVLNKNGDSRDIVAITKISLTSVNPGAPGDPLVLVGDVKEVNVVGAYNNAPLGHYDVTTK